MTIMEFLTVTEAKARLNEIVDEATSTHEQFTITKHGHPAAVLLAAEDLESMKETLFWLSQPGIHDDIAESQADIAEGRTVTSGELRERLGIPPR
jgi:prevent-host-death family protein